MQFINIYFGGTLVRDVVAWTKGEQHVAVEHRLKIVDSSYGKRLSTDSFSTNSFHTQGVTLGSLAPCLEVIAVSDAEVVEGLYHPELPVLGIQWHPERVGPDPQCGTDLFRYWLDLCADYSKAKSAARMECHPE
jgi:putative glutamine amidotransferase